MSKKKIRMILSSLFTLLVILIGITVPEQTGEVASITVSSTPTVLLTPTDKPSLEATSSSYGRHGGILVKVTKIVDGDTIKIDTGETVRYIGIDTPETVDPKKPVMCYGKEATNKNKELVEGKIVELEKDISEKDRYGRLLRYIWIEDTLINELLVREGFAHSSSYPPDIKYQNQLVAAQQLAITEQKGLWSNVCTVKPSL